MDARDELLRLKGLCDIVVRSHLKARDLVGRLALGGEHHDRRIGEGADLPAHLPAVLDGKHDIEQNDVRLKAPGELDAPAAVRGMCHLEPVLFKIQTQKFGNVAVIFHDKRFFTHFPLHRLLYRRCPNYIPICSSCVNKM